MNAGIVFSNNSVAFIDAGTTVVSGQFLWDIASARMQGDEAVYLVLTHHHSDHTFGMRVFREKAATVIAHGVADMWLRNDNGRYKATLTAMMRWTPEKADSILGDVILTAPDRTILAGTVLNLDSDQVQLLVTPGHVPSELAVYTPEIRHAVRQRCLVRGHATDDSFRWAATVGDLDRRASAIAGAGARHDRSRPRRAVLGRRDRSQHPLADRARGGGAARQLVRREGPCQAIGSAGAIDQGCVEVPRDGP